MRKGCTDVPTKLVAQFVRRKIFGAIVRSAVARPGLAEQDFAARIRELDTVVTTDSYRVCRRKYSIALVPGIGHPTLSGLRSWTLLHE